MSSEVRRAAVADCLVAFYFHSASADFSQLVAKKKKLAMAGPTHPVEWQTTSTILHRLRNQEETAWDSFIGRFRRPIVEFCRRSGLEYQDAEDVAQEALSAFATAYRAGEYDRERGRLRSWLFGIAYHQILRQRQRKARRAAKEGGQLGDGAFWDQLPDQRAAEDAWDSEWEQWVLSECLSRARREFEDQTFRAFELAVHDNQPAAAAAEALGVPVKTVYNAKHRVLKRIRELREQFEDEC